jgi:hypothetical protein
MSTFFITIILILCVPAIGQYGIAGGLAYMFLIPIGIVLLWFFISFFTSAKKIEPLPQNMKRPFSNNEIVANTLETVNLQVNYGRVFVFDDKVFIFNLIEKSGVLESSTLHCFDYKDRGNHVYREMPFSKISGCEVFKNNKIYMFCYKDDFSKEKNIFCNNGVVIYTEATSHKNSFNVFELSADMFSFFCVIDFIIKNRTIWEYNTKWETIEQFGMFKKLSSSI